MGKVVGIDGDDEELGAESFDAAVELHDQGDYEAAPNGRTSPRDASCVIDTQDDALPPRNRA